MSQININNYTAKKVPKGMKEIQGIKFVGQYYDKYCQLFSQFMFA